MSFNIWAIAAAIACAGSFAFGLHYEKVEFDLYKAQAEKKIDDLKVAQQAATSAVEIKYVDRVQTITAKGKDIVTYVDRYITPEQNSNCTIPSTFVSVSNSAIESTVPPATSKPDDSASGISLTEVAENTATNYTICNANAAQLTSLQEWVREQAKLNP